MLHQRPPATCWCGEKHTRGEVFDLNVHQRPGLPPGPAETSLAEAQEAADRHQRAEDIAAAGGWHLLTDAEADELSRRVDAAGGPDNLTTEQAEEIFRGTGKLPDAPSICSAHRVPGPGCPRCAVTDPGL
jgi:hypothetical protein